MAKNFIKNLFGRDKDTDRPTATQQQAAEGNDVKAEKIDYIAQQQTIIDAVLANITGMVQQFGIRTSEYTLLLYINEMMLFQSCKDVAFKAELVERLLMDCNYTFAGVEVMEGMPPANFSSRQLTSHAYMCLTSNQMVVDKKACLTAMEGSLVDDKVILDSSIIATLPGQRMNIGIGKRIKLQSGVIRINHIAVDDNPQGEHFDHNKYVSRSHAYITFNENEGFVLTVELGGTPAGKHRTMVFRNNKEIRMDIPGMAVPLENGDQIILSREVTLFFGILNND